MTTRADAIAFCKTLPDTYEDMPFHDPNWTVIRNKANKKVFAWIYEKDGYIWINVKCNLEWRDFWRSTYQSVLPGYHATLQMTMDLYTHVLDDHKQEEMIKLENALDEVMGNGDELIEKRYENALKEELVYKNKVVNMNGVRMA